MLKPILLGTALLFALPALAQTTKGAQGNGTATTTAEGDSAIDEEDEAATQSDGTASDRRMSTGTDAQGTTGANHNGMNHGTMNQGTAAQGGMSSGNSSGGNMSTGTMSRGTNSMGSMSGGSTSGGAMSGGAMSSSGNYGGMGGPAQGAGNYPPCSRTVTDSCIQTNERNRRR